MRLNTAAKQPRIQTHEGGQAVRINPEQQLRRSVMSCLLWEDEFYEDGKAIADRILEVQAKVPAHKVIDIAFEARKQMNLRHVPLLLLVALAGRADLKPGELKSAVAGIVSRADEIGELLAIYWRNGRIPLDKQIQRGLARAFGKFDAYQLGKYKNGTISLRDALRIVHAKPADAERSALYKALNEGTLEAPDTWEVGLSTGGDKKQTFERLLLEGKLGYMALLRNLRNMDQAGVDEVLVNAAIRARKGAEKVFPFRYVSAVEHAPKHAAALGEALLESLKALPPLRGRTVVCVDTSGSMQSPISAKSTMHRVTVAAILASMVNSDELRLVQFANTAREIPFYPGLAGASFISGQIGAVGHGTNIDDAVRLANEWPHERLIVITDEQTRGPTRDPRAALAYMINVASAKNGVGYGRWTHIDGFSEATIRFIHELEQVDG